MKYWYKFWCKIFGSLLLMRLGVVCAAMYDKYELHINADGRPVLNRRGNEQTNKAPMKTKKNPIGFHTNETEG